MRYLLFPFYCLVLATNLIWSFAKIGFYQLPPLAPLALSFIFLLAVATQTSFLAQITGTQTSFTTAPLPSLAPALTPELKQAYQTNLETWLELAEKQPTHRDVLVNISRLYQALGQIEAAQKYWDQAKSLDPNNSVFQN